MKKSLIVSVVLASFSLLSACSLSQQSTTLVVQDDLYDSYQRPMSETVSAKKKTNYLNFEDDAQIIKEDEDVVIQEPRNYINSRSIYSQGFDQGFQNGFFTSNPWNNWYSNPYMGFGGGFGNRWISPISSFGLFSTYSMMDPFYMSMNPYFRYGFGMSNYFYDPFMGYMGNNVFNNFNYYNGLNSTYAGNQTSPDPYTPRPNRGPRDGGSTNRSGGENYSNSPRGGNNTYNPQYSNQPRVNSSAGQQAAPANVAPRRNSNYESRPAPQQNNFGQSYSSPSNNSSGGSYSGGGSSGGSSGGGSSRGPR